MREVDTPPRFFVTGTDTGVGKTQASRALLSLMADAGLQPRPFKPYESGCASLRRPADAVALKEAARSELPLDTICPHRYRLPLAPGIAAEREGRESRWERTLEAFRSVGQGACVVEGAGGLFVPLDPAHDVIDLITTLRLPVLLVARAGLGTLNHTALSLEALAARKVTVAAVLLSRSSAAKDPSERDNGRLIAERHGLPVLGPVPYVLDDTRRHAAFRRALAPLLPALQVRRAARGNRRRVQGR